MLLYPQLIPTSERLKQTFIAIKFLLVAVTVVQRYPAKEEVRRHYG